MTEQTAIIFCIGHELLEGTVLDRNATFMSKILSELGHRVRSIIVLDEVEKDAIGAFKHALKMFLYLAGSFLIFASDAGDMAMVPTIGLRDSRGASATK